MTKRTTMMIAITSFACVILMEVGGMCEVVEGYIGCVVLMCDGDGD